MVRKLLIRDLTLRDGQQSACATRMSQKQIDRVLPFYKEVGFYAMEVWGGAVPDAAMRYLNEDPWERVEKIKAAVGTTTKLQPYAADATCSATILTRIMLSKAYAATPSSQELISCVSSMP